MSSYEKEEVSSSSSVEKRVSEAKKLLKSQNYFRAIDLYTDLLADTPIEVDYLISRSSAYDGIGSHKNAIIDAKLALQLSPSNLQALTALAKAYYSNSDYVKAEDTLLNALNIDAKNQKLLDLYQQTKKRLAGENVDRLESVDWVRRDASGKIINMDHSHSHDHDNDHDHDHDHDHGHDHGHSHSHDYSNQPHRNLSQGHIQIDRIKSMSHDHSEHTTPASAAKRRGSGSSITSNHDHDHDHGHDHQHKIHETQSNEKIDQAMDDFYSAQQRDNHHHSLRGSFSQAAEK